jgi:phosphogluconate dehydratase
MPLGLRETDAHGMGRELFSHMRRSALTAEEGALSWM